MPSAAPTCATSDVARVVPDRVGAPGGDFTAGTNPTATEVTAHIAATIVEVEAVVGLTVDSVLAAYATQVVAIGAASLVELGFTSKVSRDTTSKYEELRSLYWGTKGAEGTIGGMLKILADAQAALNAGDADLGLVGEAAPVATFPDPVTDLLPYSPQRETRLDTRW